MPNRPVKTLPPNKCFDLYTLMVIAIVVSGGVLLMSDSRYIGDVARFNKLQSYNTTVKLGLLDMPYPFPQCEGLTATVEGSFGKGTIFSCSSITCQCIVIKEPLQSPEPPLLPQPYAFQMG